MTTMIVGCGYLGRRIAARLLYEGERVLGTTRNAAWARSLSAFGIEPVVFDLVSSEPIQLPEFDRLVYCVSYDRASGRSVREVHVGGLTRLLDAIPRPDRFVFTSTTGVYGQDSGAWITEDDPATPRTESGRVNLEAEELVRSAGGVVVRLAGLYGPGRIIRRAALLAGEPIEGDPEKLVNLIQIDDAALATIAALDHGEPSRVYNVADDRPVTRRELYAMTATLLDVPLPPFVGSAGGDDANRRIANHRMKSELGVTLQYPDITTGLPASIAAEG